MASKKGRAKGSGYIFQQKKGGNYYLQYKINGKRKTVSLKCNHLKSKKDKDGKIIIGAEDKANEILSPAMHAKTKEQVLLNVAENRKIIKRTSVKFEDVWDLYLKSPARPQSSQGTLGNYKRMWLKFKDWLLIHHPSITSISQVDAGIAHEYAEILWDDDLSANTFNYHIGALRLVFRILANKAGVDQNPWLMITRKAEERQSRKELSENEVIAVLEKFDDNSFYLMNKNEMRVMFNLGAWTGLRLIDCALMTWSNIDFDRNRITCIPQKTKRKTQRSVTIPIHPKLKEELVQALEWKENDCVLPKITERYQFNPTGVRKDTVKVFEKSGLETTQKVEAGIQRKRKANIYGFHSFRHSFVSFCAKAGVPLPVVQSIVGHGNPAITRHYIHIGEDSVRQAINALPQGKKDNKKTSDQKIDEVIEYLNAKKKLSESEQHILKVLT
jgi:integrase